MKYIMMKDRDGRLYPIIFPDRLIHADVAPLMARAMLRSAVSGPQVSTAGFVDLAVIATHGKSETLKTSSSPLDAMVMNTYSYESGLLTALTPHTERLTLIKSVELLMRKVDTK